MSVLQGVPVLEERSLVLRLSLWRRSVSWTTPRRFCAAPSSSTTCCAACCRAPYPTSCRRPPESLSDRTAAQEEVSGCTAAPPTRFLLPPPSAYGAEEEEEEPRDEGCAAADTLRRLNRTETLPGQRDTRTEEEEEEEEADGPAGVHRFSFWPHRTHRQLPSLSPWQQGPSGRTGSQQVRFHNPDPVARQPVGF